MTLTTRPPTGKPPWPMMLVAGSEKAGKSYACAQASGSDLIGRTFWIGVGEDDPDEYGAIPGARFEIVVHDGTYRGLQTALDECAAQPDTDGKPNLIVVDSGTRLWDLLSDMAQAEANQRAVNKAQREKRPAPADDVDISMDLWNTAKNRWQHCLNALRRHRGPSLITARLETTTVMDRFGKPTKEKASKIKAEKNLPYDVGAVVELPSRGEAYLTAVRSLRLSDRAERRSLIKDFTADRLWRDLGCADATSARAFTGADGKSSLEAEDRLVVDRDALLNRLRELAQHPAELAAQWQAEHGHSLRDTTDLDALRSLVTEYEEAKAA